MLAGLSVNVNSATSSRSSELNAPGQWTAEIILKHAHSVDSNCGVKMLNVVTVIVSKMTSHCVGTVQMREESESGIRK